MSDSEINLYMPSLFVAPPVHPGVARTLHAIGTLHVHDWRVSSPALVVRYGRKWRRFRIGPSGELSISTGSRKAWRTIADEDSLNRIDAIRTRSRVYALKGTKRHVSVYESALRSVPPSWGFGVDEIVAIGGKAKI